MITILPEDSTTYDIEVFRDIVEAYKWLENSWIVICLDSSNETKINRQPKNFRFLEIITVGRFLHW